MIGGECKRILGLEASTKGFAFAVLEGTERLVDWGLVHTNRDNHALRLCGLLDLYQVEFVASKKRATGDKSPLPKISECQLQTIAANRSLRQVRISIADIESFIPAGKTRQGIAQAISRCYPELGSPPDQHCWQRDDPRLAVFIAVALGLGAHHLMKVPWTV